MAYINVETDRADFRLILGSHLTTLSANQLPARCTAILLEGVCDKQNIMYESLEGDPKHKGNTLVTQFAEFRRESKVHGIPLVAADPLVEPTRLLQAMRNQRNIGWLSYHPRFIFGSCAASLITANSGEITEQSFLFRSVNSSVELLQKHNKTPTITGRNLTIAQRAIAFAEYQRSHGVERPFVAIAAGSLHLGVVKTLRMDAKDRTAAVLRHPDLNYYFPRAYLAEILFVQYDNRRGKWKRNSFRDPLLR